MLDSVAALRAGVLLFVIGFLAACSDEESTPPAEPTRDVLPEYHRLQLRTLPDRAIEELSDGIGRAYDFAEALSTGRNSEAAKLLALDACPFAEMAVTRWRPEVDGKINLVTPPAVVTAVDAGLLVFPTTLAFPPSIVMVYRLDGERRWVVDGLSFGCAYGPPDD
jgi:hypothetical protein